MAQGKALGHGSIMENNNSTPPFAQGQRVFTCGHSFHFFVPDILADLAARAEIKVMEDYVSALNAEIGRQSVFIIPDAQATLALRERIIAGTAPGLKKQSDLFTDAWGHPSPPLKLLSAYCHFSVIYRLSPIGLPLPGVLAGSPDWDATLNRVVQQLAWESVTQHPLSGVGASGAAAARGMKFI